MNKDLKHKLLHIFVRPIISLIPNKKYRRALRNYLGSDFGPKQIEEIQSRYQNIINRIKHTSKTQKIKVVFLVSENQKWNCQSIYDQMASSEDFEPLILITNVYHGSHNDFGKYYTSTQENYEYFSSRKMNVEYAYDIDTHEFLSLDKFHPDIIFYQQPWAIHPIQDIPTTSNFALSCYVPYGICVIDCPTDYDQNFYKMLWHQYSINEIIVNHFHTQCKNLPNNYQIVGHPKLDTYLENNSNGENGYIIYAPHHSFAPSHLNFATFKWNGKFILEYAKSHPEFKFVFKPHPQLKTRLIVRKIMTEQEVDAYFDEWKKVAIFCNDADYYDLFKKSRLMITDCSSFLGEYFPSKHPVINLKNKNSIQLNPFGQAMADCYYKAYNLNELKTHLKTLLEDNLDPMQDIRLAKLQELNILNSPSSTRIINLLRTILNEKENR